MGQLRMELRTRKIEEWLNVALGEVHQPKCQAQGYFGACKTILETGVVRLCAGSASLDFASYGGSQSQPSFA